MTPEDIHHFCKTIDNPKMIGNNLVGIFKDSQSKLYVGEVETKMNQFTYARVALVLTELFRSFELFPRNSCARAFSRRWSVKSDWYSENTDSLPHIRDLDIPELSGTILDGEMKLDNKPFGEVSGLLNCTWDEAQKRQEEMNQWVTYHVFDIVRYRGIDLTSLPLRVRRIFLKGVMKILHKHKCKDIVAIPYYSCSEYNIPATISSTQVKTVFEHKELFPNLYAKLQNNEVVNKYSDTPYYNLSLGLTPREYYEFIVAIGGEGVMIKSNEGKYYFKRGREYQKIKSFLSRELVVLGFESPTKEYTGKFPNDHWDYWLVKDKNNDTHIYDDWSNYSAKQLVAKGYTPVTRYYALGLVGNLILGVCIDPETKAKLLKNKSKFKEEDFVKLGNQEFLIVCTCGGFNDSQREEFTKKPSSFIKKVVEVKANGIFTDTGKLRHPRFLRMRYDKNFSDCTFKDHISQ